MQVVEHFQLMAAYNCRMNQQLYELVGKLNVDEQNRDRGAFFKSIIGILNHIVVGDLIWLARFSRFSDSYVSLKNLSCFPVPESLDAMLFPEFSDLRQARKQIDSAISSWITDEASNEDFGCSLRYSNTKGVICKRDFGELISHLFNHQTHHRGQLTTILNQIGVDVGVTDFLMEIPDMKDNINN